MLDLKLLDDNIYKFQDGDRVINTRTLTLEVLLEINNNVLTEEQKVELAFRSMLYDSDYEDYKSLPPETKAIVCAEWLQFHAENLQKKFPSSSPSK